MRVQYRCKHARISFDPYREYCALGLQECGGCKQLELQIIEVSAETMIQDERHATIAYQYSTGTMEKTW